MDGAALKGSDIKRHLDLLPARARVSVYPMHMDHDEVVELASGKSFNLIERLFEDRIQVFGKISESLA